MTAGGKVRITSAWGKVFGDHNASSYSGLPGASFVVISVSSECIRPSGSSSPVQRDNIVGCSNSDESGFPGFVAEGWSGEDLDRVEIRLWSIIDYRPMAGSRYGGQAMNFWERLK